MKYQFTQPMFLTYGKDQPNADERWAMRFGLPPDTPPHVTYAHERDIFAQAVAREHGFTIPEGLAGGQAMDYVTARRLGQISEQSS